MAPLFKFVKYGISAFSGKKINVVACLDQFFAICKMRLKTMDFQFYQNRRQKIAISAARFDKIDIHFFHVILQIAKNRSKQATTLIFFPEKAESPYFTNLEKGGQKGGQGKANFSLKLLVKMKKVDFKWNFKLKLAFIWPPFSKFVKYRLSAFSGKKINVVDCLDQFLAICKMT